MYMLFLINMLYMLSSINEKSEINGTALLSLNIIFITRMFLKKLVFMVKNKGL